MSERKVLNKYYPPDFDPNNIPKLRRPANRQFSIRIMAPFNMRCGTCGEYIYKGKKFNSRQEKVMDEDYLGLMIFRFYIKCPRCVSEISFKTDPQNTDYTLEAGATRNFEAQRTAELQAEREWKEKEEEDKNNPMKVLENRTKSSRQEMEMIETLEELRELNSRHAKVDHELVLKKHKAYEEQLRKLQDEQDEDFIRSVFGKGNGGESVKRIHDDDDNDDASSSSSTPKAARLSTKPSDILTQDLETSEKVVKDTNSTVLETSKPRAQTKTTASWQKSVGGLSTKKSLLGLVKKKQPSSTAPSQKQTSNAGPLEASSDSSVSEEGVGTKQINQKPQLNEKAKCDADTKIVETNVEKDVNDPKPTGLGLLGAYSDSNDSDG